uniref:Ectopic P granules protein 5 homolog n=1 Tax=Acrobeloides nanus TaxID=290746 RepID=A0A914C964_9BILA
MEAQMERKPKAKPRTNIPEPDLGPPPVPPTHRALTKPLTTRELHDALGKLPTVNGEEPSTEQPKPQTSPEMKELEDVPPTVEEPKPEERSESLLSRRTTEKKDLKVNIERPKMNGDLVHSSPSTSEKEKEALSSSSVRELPLTALLPQSTSTPPPIYPAIEEEVEPVPLEPVRKAPPRPQEKVVTPTIVVEVAEEIRKYPDLREVTRIGVVKHQEITSDVEVLSEVQLLEYYQNEQLEFVDDFVDVFIQQELNPHNSLFDLLEKFKEVCERLQSTSDSKTNLVKHISTVNNEVWSVEQRTATQQGKCGDDRNASGSATYTVAQMSPEKLVELNQKLFDLTNLEMDEGLCLEVRARSLALQIQWTVVDINNIFLREHQTHANAMPTLLPSTHSLPSRRILKGALSDLFHFLRFPSLPIRFRDSVTAWIVEIGSVLLKSATTDDQIFLLCHILRIPSPIDPWATPLLQTYISIPNLDMSKPMDSFVALLSVILTPVRHREHFLNRLIKYYEVENDNSWNVVSDDGDLDNSSMIQINENDLVVLLGQFDIKSLFSVAVQHFTFITQNNRRQTLLSLISFVLILMKLFDEGLTTHIVYKNVCKKICDLMRKLVQHICSYWDLVKHELHEIDRRMIQNEINRVLLQAMQYIVSKKRYYNEPLNTVGLWQFLVAFPYGSVTEYCRQRCQILLRNSTTTNVGKLYEIPDTELAGILKRGGKLIERLSDIGKEDATFMLSALASVISQSDSDLTYFLNELIQVCFLDETTRENYYKVGSEAMSIVIERCPTLLSSILKYIDRNIDHLDEYGVDILTNSPLSNCVLTSEDVGSLLGKWLINRPIGHPANNIARRVLTSMNWGSVDQLWIPQEVHDACADTIVKAHIVHCKSKNSVIGKSIQKAAKWVTKIPDLEQQFDKFCWDVLLRLKIQAKPFTSNPSSDLTAFFVHVVQKCLASPESFIESGLQYFVDLVNSSCFNAAVVIVARLFAKFPTRVHVFTTNSSFCEAFERLLHADESSYAIQLLTGADKFPGPILRHLSSAITYHVQHSTSKKEMVLAWLSLITCRKSIEWNSDKFALYLLGTIGYLAFESDSEHFFGLVDIVANSYKNQIQQWKDSAKGISSWFSTPVPPPIIPSNLLGVSPWATYILLLAEPKVYLQFYEIMYNSMGKYPKRTLDESIKKAASKTHFNMGIDRLDYYRWLEFCLADGVASHEVFPLACQRLCITMFSRKDYEKNKHCPGAKYFSAKQSEPLFSKLRNEVLAKAEKAASEAQLASYYKAVSQWIFSEKVYSLNFNSYNDFILDHLLQMVIVGDSYPWIDFVGKEAIRKKAATEMKIYSMTCHLDEMPNASRISNGNKKFNTMTDFINFLRAPTDGQNFPAVPVHHNLPIREKLDLMDCCNTPVIVSKFSAYLDELSRFAKIYTECKEQVSSLNVKYLEMFQRLYKESQTTLTLALKCGNMLSSKCTRPVNVNVTVTSSNYDQELANLMNQNRQKREEEIGRILSMLDNMAIQSSHLEFIVIMIYLNALANRAHISFDQLRQTGQTIFYRICTSVTSMNLLFPAGAASYEACLKRLGQVFITGYPNEQFSLMRMVLHGNPLNHYIVDHFTPHCVPPDQLFHLYTELSRAVRNPSTSMTSLALLSRLDIQHAGQQMPTNQFSALMPVIFENLASVVEPSPLKQLCSDHFIHAMFHHFPHNFVSGLKLILSGCDSQAVPKEIFQTICAKLAIDTQLEIPWTPQNAAVSQKGNFVEMAKNSLLAIAEQLRKSRQDLATRMINVWAAYLDYVCRIADYFIRIIVNHTFRSDSPTSIVEQGLFETFNDCIAVWAPLLEPSPTGLAPWNPADITLANNVVDRLIRLLSWLPHNTYLPPGAETVETLIWQYFSNKLVALQRAGTTHVYSVYEAKLIGLNWTRFWPTLLDMGSMEKILVDGAPEAAPLVTELMVRIPWQSLIQHQQNQPEEAHRAFHSLFISILARVVYRAANYAKSRASVEKLLKILLDHCRWYYTKAEAIDKTGAFISSSFPNDSLTAPSDVIKAFFNIWRQVCFFSTTPIHVPNNVTDVEIPRKQAIYVRTDLKLMIKSTMEKAEQAKHYREILTKVNLILGSATPNLYLGVAKELTSFWIEISKEKNMETFSKTLVDWLNDHTESPMVLLVMNTALETLGNATPHLGLELLEKCVQVYFKRRLSCDWTEVRQWINVPEVCKQWLYSTPKSDSGIEPRFLVLNAHLMNEMATLRSAKEEGDLLKRILDYLQSIKPKHIQNEPGFLLCVEKLQRMVIRQYSNGVSVGIANEQFDAYLNFLKKIFTDEKGVSFFAMVTKFGRKPSYPQKLQLFSNLMSLYLTQQMTALGQPPRTQAGQPVLNSRIQAFKELQQNKQYQEFSILFNEIAEYFTQVQNHTIFHAGQLLTRMAQILYKNEKVLTKIDV